VHFVNFKSILYIFFKLTELIQIEKSLSSGEINIGYFQTLLSILFQCYIKCMFVKSYDFLRAIIFSLLCFFRIIASNNCIDKSMDYRLLSKIKLKSFQKLREKLKHRHLHIFGYIYLQG